MASRGVAALSSDLEPWRQASDAQGGCFTDHSRHCSALQGWRGPVEPEIRAGKKRVDEAIKTGLKAWQIAANSFNGRPLNEAWSIKSRTGEPRIFSLLASSLRMRRVGTAACYAAAAEILQGSRRGQSISRQARRAGAGAVFSRRWANGLRANWQRSETDARACLNDFSTPG